MEARSPAEALFAEFLRRLERGETIAFEKFVGEHREHAAELEELARNWGRVGGVIERLSGGSSAASTMRSSPNVGPAEVCDRLTQRRSSFERYRVDGEIARGGMGTVLRAWDSDLRRHVAMKVVLEEGDPSKESDGSGRMRRLSRFLDEAQITGQLDHPGIVPVHELGLDENGKLYFTLKLVRGRDLRSIFEQVRSGSEGWSQTRALGVLLRVCEAMSFAHERGVIHRDLKPANVMVGRHGETYVMDWGLARVLGEEDLHDLRIREHASSRSLVRSDRRDAADETPDSPLVTMDGDILGTPQYMPPEQANGELDRIGPQADVYAVGSILYELLSGHAPYLHAGTRVSPQTVWRRVIAGPPLALAKLAPGEPPELVAICEKAMAREIEERYPDMSALAEDLRAFLERRVVRAWRTGPVIELRKWIDRNRAFAGALAALLVLLVAAGFVTTALERARQRERLDRLATAYLQEAERSWPIHPDSIPEMKRWLTGAREIVHALPATRAELEALGESRREPTSQEVARGLDDGPYANELRSEQYLIKGYQELIEKHASVLADAASSSEAIDEAGRGLEICQTELEQARGRLADLDVLARRDRGWKFDDEELAARYARLAKREANLDDLAWLETGVIARVEKRLELARTVRERSIDAHRAEWDRAIASIANVDECKVYGGLKITEQLGLVPLRQDPHSGLWEFWCIDTGEAPRFDASAEDSELEIDESSAIVLVLVPGGLTRIGAEVTDEQSAAYDSEPYALLDMRVNPLSLDAFFLSKYEIDQAQWLRMGGGSPSTYSAGHIYDGEPQLSRLHPVESVSLEQSRLLLQQYGLDLPTSAQWEHAARAGGPGKFGGPERRSPLPSRVNLGGADDSWGRHAPVDAEARNDWGLVGMLGNVSEWIKDANNPNNPRYDHGAHLIVEGTGERLLEFGLMHTAAGGNWLSSPTRARLANRFAVERGRCDAAIGIRVCRRLVP